MSSWPDVVEDGYVKRENQGQDGRDLWQGGASSVESCKAVCNANSKCKSIYHGRDGVCYLKTWTEDQGSIVSTTNGDTYYKQGEPAKDKHMYLTKPISAVKNWEYAGLNSSENGCRNGAERVGFNLGGATGCSWMPDAAAMCPSEFSVTNKDFVYFRHDMAPWTETEPVVDFRNCAFGACSRDAPYAWQGNFGGHGSRISMYKDKPIRCGYNRIRKNRWADLATWFDDSTIEKIKDDYCTGPGVTSTELYYDNECKSYYTTKNSLPKYNQTILTKLQSESNWYTDDTKVKMFEDVAKKQDNTQKVADLINSLPDTNWSDQLVKSLNAILMQANVSSVVSTAIENKTKSYCNASNRNSNEKCGCYNAIDYKLQNCKSDIKGCEEMAELAKGINELKGGTTESKEFANKLENDFYPETNAKYCRRAGATDPILKYRMPPPGATTQNYSACFSNIQNSGIINADSIKLACNVKAGGGDDSEDVNGSGSGSGSGSGFSGLFGSDSESDGNNNYLLIGVILLFLCCMCLGGITAIAIV